MQSDPVLPGQSGYAAWLRLDPAVLDPTGVTLTPSQDDTVRIAVIGAGSVAQQMHLPYLAELRDRFTVVGVCDVSPSLAERAAAPFGAVATTDRRRLLDLRPDAVLIAVNGPSEDLTVEALESGADVLVEKPMAWTRRRPSGSRPRSNAPGAACWSAT